MELRRLGVGVIERRDGLVVHGSGRVRGGVIVSSHGDHRVLMALSVLGLACDNPIEILGADCIDVSYPSFFGDLKMLGARIEVIDG